ncbi:MAG: YggS family pyridoxal phosphate-dependent enzyme [Candidatus Micrarchaeia archaeon]
MSIKGNISALDASISGLAPGRKALLVAVSKNRTAAEVVEAYSAGVRDFGENRMQEALPKMKEVEALLTGKPGHGMKTAAASSSRIKWHFIGTLQSNKACDAAANFDYIHSVDSTKLIDRIASCQQKTGKRPKCFIQANVSGEESKHGFAPSAALDACGHAMSKGIDVVGFMGMGPETSDISKSRAAFILLDSIRKEAQVRFSRRFIISAGMTSDYKAALECGSDIVRIGRAAFE